MKRDGRWWSLTVTNEDDSLDQIDGRKKTPQTSDQLVACAIGLIEDVKHIG